MNKMVVCFTTLIFFHAAKASDCAGLKQKFDHELSSLDRNCLADSDCIFSDHGWDPCKPKGYINKKNLQMSLNQLVQLRSEAHRACKFIPAPCPSIPPLAAVCRNGLCEGKVEVIKIPTH